MIRAVALPKAIVAGLAGAAAMEALSFVVRLAGVPAVDFVTELNSVTFRTSPLLANTVGLVVHLSVGVCWAVFYAFFFWGRFRLQPALQGLIFAILPATLALLIVYPELALMRVPANIISLGFRDFFAPLTWTSAGSILVAHALFGLTVGALYRRPVGYRVERTPPLPARRRTEGSRAKRRESGGGFIFATGIECSYPTIEKARWRRDEMESVRHYERWQNDFELARQIGVTHIRYGPPLHLI
jgi:hypothetical protein